MTTPTPPRCARPGLLELTVLLVLSLASVLLWGSTREPKLDNERAAAGSLETIAVAQPLMREQSDESGSQKYGTLAQLRQAKLIDDVLGAGTKHGYTFTVIPSPTTPELLWFATANPVEPFVTGDTFFATNNEGVLFATIAGPVPFRADCALPSTTLTLPGK